MKTKKNTKISIKEVVKKPFFLVPMSIIGFLFICSLSLVIWKPGIVKGEYSIQSIVDMLLNHEERISNLETKTDETQTQTNQNTEDVKKLQDSTGTQAADPVDPVQTPVAKVPAPKDETPVVEDPEPEPVDPNNNSWTTTNGTFVFKDFLTTASARLGKNFVFNGTNMYNGRQCNFTLPAGTVGYKDYRQIYPPLFTGTSSPYTAKSSALVFDLRPAYPNGICGTKSWQQGFSNDPNNKYFPGNFDIWW